MRPSYGTGAFIGALLCAAALLPGEATAQSSAVRNVSEGWSRAETTTPADWSGVDVDDSLWPVTSLNTSWHDQGLDGFSGNVWYRRTLTLPDRAAQDAPRLAVLVGPLSYGSWTLYADGVAIGQLGTDADALPFPRIRLLELSDGSVADGRVTLALRVHRTAWAADQSTGWGTAEALLVGPADVLGVVRDAMVLKNKEAQVGGLLFALAAILFGAYHLLLFGFRPSQSSYLWFGAAAVAFGLNALSFSPWVGGSFVHLGTAYRMSSASGHAATAMLLLFFWKALDRTPGRLVGGYVLSHVLLGVLVLLTPLHWVLATEVARFVWLVPGLAMALGLLVLELRDGHPDATTLAAGVLAIAGAEISEMLRAAGAGLPEFLPFAGFLVALLAVSATMANRFAREHRELAELRSALERRVEERTGDLARTSQAAQRASDAKSRFLTNMSHELRTPLNAVIGFANIIHKRALRTGGTIRDREMDFLDRIRSNGTHLLALVDRLLDLSRIESGTVELEYSEVELGPMVGRLLAELSPEAVAKGLTLHAVVPERLPPLYADATRLKQILMNLVDNALRFTDEGSVTVRIEAGSGRARRIEVVDTGRGIPPERINELMAMFTQADESPARSHHGLGLGLAIAHSLSRVLGYELTLESEPGSGTVARIDLEPELTQTEGEFAAKAPASRTTPTDASPSELLPGLPAMPRDRLPHPTRDRR